MCAVVVVVCACYIFVCVGVFFFFFFFSRRSELAAYCATYSVDCIYKYLVKHGHVRPINSVGTVLAAFALGLMFKNHKDQPVLLTRWILGIGKENE
jgi:hypothetical protein